MTDAVRDLRADTLSGASELIVRGARVLRDHAQGSRARSARAFVASMAKIGLMVADAQPAMAPFIHLADAALKAAEEAKDAPAARRSAVEAIDAFVAAAGTDRERTAKTAARLVRRDSVVMVYSRSPRWSRRWWRRPGRASASRSSAPRRARGWRGASSRGASPRRASR